MTVHELRVLVRKGGSVFLSRAEMESVFELGKTYSLELGEFPNVARFCCEEGVQCQYISPKTGFGGPQWEFLSREIEKIKTKELPGSRGSLKPGRQRR